jgi:hypothetical protein
MDAGVLAVRGAVVSDSQATKQAAQELEQAKRRFMECFCDNCLWELISAANRYSQTLGEEANA